MVIIMLRYPSQILIEAHSHLKPMVIIIIIIQTFYKLDCRRR